jgi:hypothetical protein
VSAHTPVRRTLTKDAHVQPVGVRPESTPLRRAPSASRASNGVLAATPGVLLISEPQGRTPRCG